MKKKLHKQPSHLNLSSVPTGAAPRLTDRPDYTFCATGHKPPKLVTRWVGCPVLCCNGRMKADHRPEKDSPVVLRCMTCNIHFEVRNPRSFLAPSV